MATKMVLVEELVEFKIGLSLDISMATGKIQVQVLVSFLKT